MENKKGTFCPYKKCLLCQEGICRECEIYLKRLKGVKQW